MSASEFHCPICRNLREPAHQINICAPCHGDLVSHGQIKLSSTGEFSAMSLAEATAVLRSDQPSQAAQKQSAQTAACSWCGKSATDAKKLLSNRGAHICNECVALCADIMSAELGSDWR